LPHGQVPAFIYMLGNNILYLALRYLDAPVGPSPSRHVIFLCI
jgi:hypothetical protein